MSLRRPNPSSFDLRKKYKTGALKMNNAMNMYKGINSLNATHSVVSTLDIENLSKEN